MINHTASEDTLDFFVTMAMQGSPKATPECVTAFSATDFRGDLAKITVPTMIIHGTGGATVPIDVSGRRAAKLVANGSSSNTRVRRMA